MPSPASPWVVAFVEQMMEEAASRWCCAEGRSVIPDSSSNFCREEKPARKNRIAMAALFGAASQ